MLIAFSVTEQSQWKFICIGLYTPGLNDDKSDIILKHFEAVRDMRVSDESRISVGGAKPKGRKFWGPIPSCVSRAYGGRVRPLGLPLGTVPKASGV